MRPVITSSVGMQNVTYAPEGSEAIVEDILVKGEYDCFLDGFDISILDIGANVGAFSMWALRRFPHSEITAYEPVKEVYDCLVKNTEFYSCIKAHNRAVSSDSSFTMTVNKDRFYMSGTLDNHASSDNVEIRQVETIHPKDLPVADIVKVDTEGAEVDILTKMDLSGTTLVIVEVHSPELMRGVMKHMEETGFYLWCALRYLHSGVGEFVFANSNYWNPKIRSLYLDKDSYKASSK